MKTNYITIFIFLALNVAAFAQSSSGESLDRRVQEALQRMDDLIDGSVGRNTTPVQSSQGGAEPLWVSGHPYSPHSIYSQNQYFAAVGYGKNRAEAERSAFATLVATFGLSVQSGSSEATVYSEATSRGIVNVSKRNDIQHTIVTAASLDSLVGAEIGNIWDNGSGMVFALAYASKEKIAAIYSELIHVNLLNIENLLNDERGEKNTFNHVARYRLAALISGINEKYANIIMLTGGDPASSFNLTSANALNIEASNILKNIAVVVRVDNDRNNRIRDAFAGVLNREGLLTRGNNPPYTLEVAMVMNKLALPGSEYIWCGFTISSQLVENTSNAVLLPFNHTGREAHMIYERAVDMALLEMERKINEQYSVVLREYLSAQLPQK